MVNICKGVNQRVDTLLPILPDLVERDFSTVVYSLGSCDSHPGWLMSVMVSRKWLCGFMLHHGTATCFQEPVVRNIYAIGKETFL